MYPRSTSAAHSMDGRKRPAVRLCLAAALLISGATAAMADGPLARREAIVLSPAEYEFMLNEMNGNMMALQAAYAAIAAGDWNRAADAAATRGTATFGDGTDKTRPATLTAKLPRGWRAMAGNTKRGFDDLARDLRQNKNPASAIAQLAALHQGCNQCHMVYRLAGKP